MTKQKILIVDDEKPTRDAMARILSKSYECLTAADADLAMKIVDGTPDLVLLLTDYKMPGTNGIELIKRAKGAIPSLGAILITAFGEIELAVNAMKQGADDFLTKPITDLDQLELKCAQAIKTNGTTAATRKAKPVGGALGLDSFTGESPVMQRLYDLIRRVAPTDASVLVEGPSGTGKELVARALHDLSARASAPFVAVECSALSKDLMESELFGYEPNSFTGASATGKIGRFEAANGGTLFLDEIGEIDLATQVKLLRALESRKIQRVGGHVDIPVDFRLVAATNRNLAEQVVNGHFREDLYYRLNVIALQVPPLKERPGDIPLLVNRYLGEFSPAYGNRVKAVSPELMAMLEAYDWPGNVRQLRNAVERMTVLAGGETLTPDDLPPEIRPQAKVSPESAVPITQPPPGAGTLADTEKDRILAALRECGGNKSRAAEKLGISRRTIHRKINEWNLP